MTVLVPKHLLPALFTRRFSWTSICLEQLLPLHWLQQLFCSEDCLVALVWVRMWLAQVVGKQLTQLCLLGSIYEQIVWLKGLLELKQIPIDWQGLSLIVYVGLDKLLTVSSDRWWRCWYYGGIRLEFTWCKEEYLHWRETSYRILKRTRHRACR